MNRYLAIIGAFISGILIYLAALHAVPFLVWIALIPLFLSTHNCSSFLPALVAATTFSIFAFAWMIPGARAFTGASTGYGIIIFVVCVAAFSFGCATLLWFTPPALIAPVWILAEMILQQAAEKMPWFLFHIGNGLASSLYAIQPMSVIGVAGAGFVVIEVNYLAALAIRRRSWKYAGAPMLLFICYMTWGWWLLPPAPSEANSSTGQHPSFTLSILRENIPPEITWDQANGPQLVQQLLQQEDRCIAGHPQMILWAESAIPWTYSPDDDLVGELLRHSRPQSITHILGMNTAITANINTNIPTKINTNISTGTAISTDTNPAASNISSGTDTTISANVVRNSAYCLLPDGKIAGRYDKRKPLLFIEQPGPGGWLIPFFSSGGYSVEPGDNDLPLTTPYGKAGVLICNESALPSAAASRVRQGAQFLLNMSNDGWFRDTWLVAQHFYNTRLRAVETRKDIAVNSNNGWSGCIYASGRVDQADRTGHADQVDTTATVFTIHPNNDRPIAVHYPLLPAYVCLFFLFTIIIKTKRL